MTNQEAQEPGWRVAAIDVGSNALRLLFMQVLLQKRATVFRKVSLIRMPLRLGLEAFSTHRLQPATVDRLVLALSGFRQLIQAWEPVSWRGCATASLRSIENGPEVLRRIEQEAGVELEIISGQREAELLLRNQPLDWHPETEAYLYVDVGGGSTELTLLRGGKVVASQSWPLGTVRLLLGEVDPRAWVQMSNWLAGCCKGLTPVCVGSGGNINKLASLLRRAETEPIKAEQVRGMLEKVEPMSVEQRVLKLGLRPDRADVFPHALRIYLQCMEAAGARIILAPRMGLADALVREAWQEWRDAEAGQAKRKTIRA
ncbi:MAG: exopolyphosphatase [Candidatus Delongbacteria bacterium]